MAGPVAAAVAKLPKPAPGSEMAPGQLTVEPLAPPAAAAPAQSAAAPAPNPQAVTDLAKEVASEHSTTVNPDVAPVTDTSTAAGGESFTPTPETPAALPTAPGTAGTPAPPAAAPTAVNPNLGGGNPYQRFGPTNVENDLTPADLYGVGGSYQGLDALARGIKAGNPYAEAIRGAFIYGEAAKFAVDPNYNPITDPEYAGKPDRLIPVLAARSKQEAHYIDMQMGYWRMEQAKLGNSGTMAAMGQVFGMFLDPAMLVGFGEESVAEGMVRAGAGHTAADTRLMAIRNSVLSTVTKMELAALPGQAGASAFDPLRPAGSLFDQMLSIGAAGAVFGAITGAMKPLAKDVALHGLQNSAVDPLVAGAGGGAETKLDWRTPDGFNAYWDRGIRMNEGGGADVVGISTAPNAMKVPPDQRAAGVGQVIPSTARQIAHELGEDSLLAGKSDAEVQKWLMETPAPDVYHGSPTAFDGFSADLQGTGEGGAGQGAGIYLSDHPMVGNLYREPGNVAPTTGHLYHVEIKRPLNTFMDMNKPLSEQPAISEKVKNLPGYEPGMTGQQLYNELKARAGGSTQASAMLDRAGVHGGVFVSDEATGARNFVVYNSNDLRIIKRADSSEAVSDMIRTSDPNAKQMSNSERYGRHYYQGLLKQYDDPVLAAAAYDAGPAAVDRWLKANGDPRTGKISMDDWIKAIPGEGYAETRDYLTSFRKRMGSDLNARPRDPIRNESVGAGKPGEGGTAHDMTGTVFRDAKGNQVSTPEQARTITFPGKVWDIDKISLVDAKGAHVGGAPLAEGRPAYLVDDAHVMLDHAGAPTADPYSANKVVLPGFTQDINRFAFHDAAGNPLMGGAGAMTATLLDKMAEMPGLGSKIASMRRWIAEAADWIITAPIEGGRYTPQGLNVPRSEAESAGAARVEPRIAPGATSYAGAQALHGEAMVSAFGLEKLKTNPILRLLNSSSLAARDIVTRLTQIGGMQVKNTWGVASRVSVWTKYGLMKGQINEALRFTDEQYAKYAQRMIAEQGKPEMNFGQRWKTAYQGQPGVMSKKEFFQATGKAKRYGANSRNAAGLPQEAIDAAAFWDKKVYKPIADRADQHNAFLQPLEDQLLDLHEKYITALHGGHLAAAKKLRGDMNELAADIAKTKGKPTYKPDYMNRIYDQRALSAHPDEFKQILKRYIPGLTNQSADEILSTLQKAQPYQAFGPDMIGRASSLHERTLAMVPDHALESFLEQDISIAGNAYGRGIGVDSLMAEEFQGDMNLNHALDAIVADYNDLRKQPGANIAKLQKDMNADLQDIRALRDMVRGTYGLPKDPQGWTSRAIRLAKNFNISTQLTGFVSALPDLARVPMVHGINQTMGTMLQGFQKNSSVFKLGRKEAQLAGEASEVMTALNQGLFGHISDSFAGTTKAEDIIQHIASGRMALDGMGHFQDSIKSFTALVAGSQIIDGVHELMDAVRAGKELPKGTMSKLAASYIDAPMAERIADQFRRYGHSEGHVRLANTELWQDELARDTFRAALNREINTTIAGAVTPGERPLWMSSELGSILSQYRTYGFTSMQRVLIPGLQQRDRQFLFGAVAMVGLGMMTDMLLSQARGEDYDSKPWGTKLTNAVDRSGVLGWGMDLNNALQALSFGHLGVGSGGGSVERAAAAVGGPTVSTFANLMRAIGGNQDNPRTRQAQLRLLPLYNIWQTRQLMNMVSQNNDHRGQGPTIQQQAQAAQEAYGRQ